MHGWKNVWWHIVKVAQYLYFQKWHNILVANHVGVVQYCEGKMTKCSGNML